MSIAIITLPLTLFVISLIRFNSAKDEMNYNSITIYYSQGAVYRHRWSTIKLKDGRLVISSNKSYNYYDTYNIAKVEIRETANDNSYIVKANEIKHFFRGNR